jgi:hypothetical protein
VLSSKSPTAGRAAGAGWRTVKMGCEAIDALVAAHPPAHDPEKHALGLRPDVYATVVLS